MKSKEAELDIGSEKQGLKPISDLRGTYSSEECPLSKIYSSGRLFVSAHFFIRLAALFV